MTTHTPPKSVDETYQRQLREAEVEFQGRQTNHLQNIANSLLQLKNLTSQVGYTRVTISESRDLMRAIDNLAGTVFVGALLIVGAIFFVAFRFLG